MLSGRACRYDPVEHGEIVNGSIVPNVCHWNDRGGVHVLFQSLAPTCGATALGSGLILLREFAMSSVSVRRPPALRLLSATFTRCPISQQAAIEWLAEDCMERRLEIEGNMRDVMATVPALFGDDDPTRETGAWLPRFVNRIQPNIWGRTYHSRAKDRAQTQLHFDVSDDRHAAWLDPQRVLLLCMRLKSGHDRCRCAGSETRPDLQRTLASLRRAFH